MSSPVLVIGGTRGTGLEIVRKLRRDGHPVRALARDESRARATLGPDIEICLGDVTKPNTLAPAVANASHVIFTAGVTKRPSSEAAVIAVEYDGVRHTIAAAMGVGFAGRFLYMTTIGVTRHSIESIALNLIKGNTMKWRRRAEEEIRRSGINYTVVRCGVLTNGDVRRPVELSQENHPMSLRRRISRGAAAEVFVQALAHPGSARTTFDAYWASGSAAEPWDVLFARLRRDASQPISATESAPPS